VTTAAEILANAIAADDENAGIVNLLVNDPDLERLVAVWANVPIPQDTNPDEECPPDLPEAVRLRWVWSRLEPDPIPVWILLAGLPDAPHVRRVVRLAIDNRVVFPNGAMSTWAQVYLQQQARRTLGIRPDPQPVQEPAAPAEPQEPDAPRPTPYVDDGMIRPGRRLRGAGGGV